MRLIKAGDIYHTLDGELYMLTQDTDGSVELSDTVISLTTADAIVAPNWVKQVAIDGFEGQVSFTGINMCDIIKRITDETK